MKHKERKITLDKVLVVGIIIGMFALAATESLFSHKSGTNASKMAVSGVSNNCMYICR